MREAGRAASLWRCRTPVQGVGLLHHGLSKRKLQEGRECREWKWREERRERFEAVELFRFDRLGFRWFMSVEGHHERGWTMKTMKPKDDANAG